MEKEDDIDKKKYHQKLCHMTYSLADVKICFISTFKLKSSQGKNIKYHKVWADTRIIFKIVAKQYQFSD